MSRHSASTDEGLAGHSVQLHQVLVAASLIATALAFGGCRHGRPIPGTSSSWTDYRPTDAGKAATFATATSPTHFHADLPQDTYPAGPNGPIYINITPEAAVNTFDVKEPFGPDKELLNQTGRVMARIDLKDTKNDFDCLKAGKNYEYVVWWVETLRTTDFTRWQSHYYLVDPTQGSESVTECGAQGRHSFWFEREAGTNGTQLGAGAFNKHRFPGGPAEPDTVPRFGGPGSTWVACGGGCCNGR